MQYVISPSPDNLLNKAHGSWRRIISSQMVFTRTIHLSVGYTRCQMPGFPRKLSSITHQRYASHFTFRDMSRYYPRIIWIIESIDHKLVY